MGNIYDIFNNLQHNVLNEEYNSINNSFDEYKIFEREIYSNSLMENIIYNNPEKKRLDVLLEEVTEKKETDLFKWITEQMKKVMNWIMNIFNHQKALFQKGADLVASNDLNKLMINLKTKKVTDTIKYHSQKPTFQTVKSTCSNKINKTINSCKSKLINNTLTHVFTYEDIIDKEDLESTFLDNFRKKLRLTDEDLNEVRITQLNVLNIHNTLSLLPKANSEIESIKRKVEDLYKKLANQMKNKASKQAHVGINQTHKDARTENKAEAASNSMNRINGLMKKINELIRAYSKILTLVFKEDYKAAMSIINLANGRSVDEDSKENKTQGKVLKFNKKA